MINHNELISGNQPEILRLPDGEREEKYREEEALSAARAEELSRSYFESSLPQGFKFNRDGWLVFQKESDNNDESESIKICSRLDVLARSRNHDAENHGRLLQFADPDGVLHQWAMPMQMLAGDGFFYRQELLSKGLLIAPGARAKQLLTSYIQACNPPRTVRCVEQPGWTQDGSAFVFAHDTIGNCGDEALILQSTMNIGRFYKASGTIEDWKKIMALCQGNSKLSFAVSAAFAPPLLFLLGMESGGIHFRGCSASGKTTILRVAGSVWGGHDYVQSWRATANGLEGVAASFNDGLLCLDEIAEIESADAGRVAYMLANGQGKLRSEATGDAKKSKKWRVLFLSSGETALSEHMMLKGFKAKAGQEVRVLDIPADTQTYGCFQNLHGFEQAKAFAEQLGELSRHSYGHAGPLFVRQLIPIRFEVINKARRAMQRLFQEYVPASASGQVQRAFNRFALIAVAGELASEFGITGWRSEEATDAAMNCFNDWLQARGGLGSQEEKVILSQVRYFFQQHGESRFSPWGEDDDSPREGKTMMRAGYRKMGDDGEEFYVFPEVFKTDVISGFDSELAAKVCLKHGVLMGDSNGKATRSERLPGMKRTRRVYRFTSKVLAEEA